MIVPDVWTYEAEGPFPIGVASTTVEQTVPLAEWWHVYTIAVDYTGDGAGVFPQPEATPPGSLVAVRLHVAGVPRSGWIAGTRQTDPAGGGNPLPAVCVPVKIAIPPSSVVGLQLSTHLGCQYVTAAVSFIRSDRPLISWG